MGREQLLEKDFETVVCEGLAESGWLYEGGGSSAGWDPVTGLHRQDALGWLASEYGDEYVKVVSPGLSPSDRTRAEDGLLAHLSKELGRKPVVGKSDGHIQGGLLGVLRHGFAYAKVGSPTARFGGMAAFRPASVHLVDGHARAGRNVMRVMRQVRFDPSSGETVDLVLTVNGVPVATMELKTDNVQSVQDAMAQYRKDRVPGRGRTLLEPGRCLVHFAVSNEEAWMTTLLQGADTVFLPFNQGDDGHAGNPVSERGSATSYLWEWVLERERALRILKDYAVWEKKGAKDGRLVFPRFHQLRAVEALVDDVVEHGTGRSYLVQHSAGSGKTKTIAWLSHRLARLLDEGGDPVFDSVILVSDRRALDANLVEGVGLLQAAEGMVATIGSGSGSKSKQLEQALAQGKRIITCTLQTFPEVLGLIDASSGLGSRSWCVVADEAHSSQSGEASRALRELLGTVSGDDVDPDDLVLTRDSAVAGAANVSFVAFTATPKPATVRLFGTKDEASGQWLPFDSYTMAQAIEEGFILDVLTNYSTYSMFAQVRDAIDRDELVDKNAAVSQMVRFVQLHPTSIAQKVEIVVEHFLRNVAHHLGGNAKAMVVADGREAAFTWSRQMNAHIVARGLQDRLRTLVAFSGELEVAGQKHTESSLNGGVGDPGKAFKADDSYRVMIVADKYQTGYDEPRLCAMYVDKPLSGIASVQTLSRLNRIFPGKPAPMVLDFVNDPERIQADFEPFYSDAWVEKDVDPNALYHLGQSLDAAGIYDRDGMAELSAAYQQGAGHERLRALVAPMAKAWHQGMSGARQRGDADEVQRLRAFRKDLRSYERAWSFMSQFVDFQDAEVHQRADLAGILLRNLREDHAPGEDYVSGLEVSAVVFSPERTGADVGLLGGSDEPGPMDLPGLSGAATVLEEGSRERQAFDEVVDWLNEHFRQLGLASEDSYVRDLVTQIVVEAAADKRVNEIITGNEDRTAEDLCRSRGLRRAIDRTFWRVAERNQARMDAMAADPDSMAALRRGVVGVIAGARAPGGESIMGTMSWSVSMEDGHVAARNISGSRLRDVVLSTSSGSPVEVPVVEPGASVSQAAGQGRPVQVEIQWRVTADGPVEVFDAVVHEETS